MGSRIQYQPGAHSFYGFMHITIESGNPVVLGATLNPGFSDDFFAPFYQLPLVFESSQPFEMTIESLDISVLSKREVQYYIRQNEIPGYTEINTGIYYSPTRDGPVYAENLLKTINNCINRDIPSWIFLAGPKGSGTTTFSKYVANRVLSTKGEVGYIDIDPGRPELSLPGTISYTHLSAEKGQFLLKPCEHQCVNADNVIYFGSTNIVDSISTYMECVKMITSYASRDIYVIIRSFGWVEDIGLDLQHRAIEILNPANVFAITRNDQRAAILRDRMLYGQIAARSGLVTLKQEEKRDLVIESYLWTDRPISAQTPQIINLSNIFLSFGCLNVPPTESLRVLNGSFVTLCRSKKSYNRSDKLVSIIPKLGACDASACGVVVGVNIKAKEILIVSPANLAECDFNVIAVGNIHTPRGAIEWSDGYASYMGVGLYEQAGASTSPLSLKNTPVFY